MPSVLSGGFSSISDRNAVWPSKISCAALQEAIFQVMASLLVMGIPPFAFLESRSPGHVGFRSRTKIGERYGFPTVIGRSISKRGGRDDWTHRTGGPRRRGPFLIEASEMRAQSDPYGGGQQCALHPVNIAPTNLHR